jgi:hypothetical protein
MEKLKDDSDETVVRDSQNAASSKRQSIEGKIS